MKRNTGMGMLIISPNFRFSKKAGGPGRTLAAMVDRSQHLDSTRLLSSDRDHGGERLPVLPNKWITDTSGMHIKYLSSKRAPLTIILTMLAKRDQILYFNSYYSPLFGFPFIILAALLGRRLIIAPRGQLNPGAALQKRAAKTAINYVVRRTLRHNAMFHASSDDEAIHIRATFPNNRIIVHENETSLPKMATLTATRPSNQLLFLGRLHPHKGLHHLLSALRSVTTHTQLTVVGDYASAEYRDTCEKLASELQMIHYIHFIPAVEPDAVHHYFRNASALVLPTAGENFGHVIAEALSNSCPTLVTPLTPWTHRLPNEWRISTQQTSLAATLSDWTSRPCSSMQESRRRAYSIYNAWSKTRSEVSFIDRIHAQYTRVSYDTGDLDPDILE